MLAIRNRETRRDKASHRSAVRSFKQRFANAVKVRRNEVAVETIHHHYQRQLVPVGKRQRIAVAEDRCAGPHIDVSMARIVHQRRALVELIDDVGAGCRVRWFEPAINSLHIALHVRRQQVD